MESVSAEGSMACLVTNLLLIVQTIIPLFLLLQSMFHKQAVATYVLASGNPNPLHRHSTASLDAMMLGT